MNHTKMQDVILNTILEILTTSKEPLDTKEIEERLKPIIKKESVTRIKTFYRLNILRGESKIKGKFIGAGKGVWIWWTSNLF